MSEQAQRTLNIIYRALFAALLMVTGWLFKAVIDHGEHISKGPYVTEEALDSKIQIIVAAEREQRLVLLQEIKDNHAESQALVTSTLSAVQRDVDMLAKMIEKGLLSEQEIVSIIRDNFSTISQGKGLYATTGIEKDRSHDAKIDSINQTVSDMRAQIAELRASIVFLNSGRPQEESRGYYSIKPMPKS